MKLPTSVYEPREDSELMLKWAKKLAHGNILEVGCGSGYISTEFESSCYTGVDINPIAVAYCKKYRKGTFIRSNLFSHVPLKRFDTIIFNPPYLPSDVTDPDPALDGGKHGYETILNFLSQAGDYLSSTGSILLLYSSLSKPSIIEEYLAKNLWDVKKLEKHDLFMESLFLIAITKKDLRIAVEQQSITSLQFVAKGKRSFVFKGIYKNIYVAVKVHSAKNLKLSPTEHEAAILTKVNKKRIGPKILIGTKEYIVLQWIEGVYFPQALKIASAVTCKALLLDLLKQSYTLDMLGIQKEEMHRPLKNVLVSGVKVVLLDFERARRVPKPHNVTQCVQFISSNHLRHILAPKGVKYEPYTLRKAANVYNRKPSSKNYETIVDLVQKPNTL